MKNDDCPVCYVKPIAISGIDSLEVPTVYTAYFLALCAGYTTNFYGFYGRVPPF